MSKELKVGDTVVITETEEYEFQVGDKAVLTNQDAEGDWWAEFDKERAAGDGDSVWCIEKGYSKCELAED